MDSIRLKDYFDQLLRTEYSTTEKGGDYACFRDGSTIYFFFEQSDGFVDWINNFRFISKAYKNCEHGWSVHGGFLRVWKSMKDEIEAYAKHEIDSGGVTDIVCIGYSHGGPMAGFAVEDLKYIYGDTNINIEGIGFASPRFVWGPIPKCVKERFESFTVVRNDNDLVTHLPPKLFGYRHVGNIFTIKNPYHKTGCIDSHRPENYTDALKYIS